ncbi:AAA family ATPase [Halalkalibacterium halodurans]|uniref:AAA family ATPase n=1 Tax=Halalkalibacterium halodurans TaxID=86665 RepID=UPI0006A95BD0|nr:AAA family ATPase [Halalkalibacterium halodurans]TPE70163.1 AAA family ATPase [Halalkalibacterium halodurans]
MCQNERTIEQFEAELQAFLNGTKVFSEARGLQWLSWLEENEQYTKGKADLLALIAGARLQRKGEADKRTKQWLDEGLNLEPENPRLLTLELQQVIEAIRDLPLPATFPTIRETDHGTVKKKTALRYFELAEQFFEHESSYRKALDHGQQGAEATGDEHKKQAFVQLNKLFTSLREPLLFIVKATEEYAHSVSGVYYSKSQFQQIRQAVEEIEALHREWTQVIAQMEEEARPPSSPLDELEKMVGLEDVKRRVHHHYQFLKYQVERKKAGYQFLDEMSLHMILTGNPGTGKTRLARLFAQLYYELGLLERNEVLEVDRSQLVGGFVGQSEENTKALIEKAAGGVLFIDEAYSLKREGASGNDYGQAVIDTLVAAMTSGKYAGTFALILAGYPVEMEQFLRSNPGLRSRFPEQNQIHLSDYSIDELLLIGEQVALDNDFTLTDGARLALKQRIEEAQVDESFGNGRTVKNIVMNAIFQKGAKVQLDQAHVEDFALLTRADFLQEDDEQKEEGAIDRLEQLIGLADVKRELKQLTSFAKVQQMRRDKGMTTIPIQLHSIFSGNPGTGKTTVAKLFAEALQEIGLLKRGHVSIVSRSDLVAGFVGQTALKTKERIRDALGGVLFIDEAYSLFKGGQDFGKEAVDTLVDEMTKQGENLVVIMAGYPKEMEELLTANPGLKSRFKKVFTFADYTKAELQAMIDYHSEQYGYHLDEEARRQVGQLLPESGHPSNGRFAVDLLERAIQRQAIRITEIEEDISEEQLMTLTGRDFIEEKGGDVR